VSDTFLLTPPTKDFKETVRERLARDPHFKEALRMEALRCLKSGETKIGQIILRDYLEREN
jgi:hypothetical protein